MTYLSFIVRCKVGTLILLAVSSVAPHYAFAGNVLEISNLIVEPLATIPGSRYKISVNISSTTEKKPSVNQLYQLRDHLEFIAVSINDDGKFADKKANDGIYSGTTKVPQSASYGLHKFKVQVQDLHGNRSNELYYTFTVQRSI